MSTAPEDPTPTAPDGDAADVGGRAGPTGGYTLGIDLGTTFTAAAIAAPGGSAEIVSLGHTTAVVPSVIVVRDDGQVLVGEAAERRAESEPTRTAREFKRRLGDPVPFVLGGTPFGADALTGHLLRHVYDRVVEQQGARPSSVVVTHPANYGEYKLDLVREAIRLADIADVSLLSEPAAAATHYAQQDRLAIGDVVAVYDFGGGTFDAAVLEVTDDGYRIIGTPEGMERLGGIDFDQAVFAHVMASLGDVADRLDPTDAATAAGLSRLRDECREAKEALSSDTDVDIPVLLPNLHTEVRLTRPEFETMVRPRVAETTESLARAIRSAGLEPADITKVLLVGGSSRIPLVAEMVGASVGRPVALDAHPKHSIALGAALHAAGSPSGGESAPAAIAGPADAIGTPRNDPPPPPPFADHPAAHAAGAGPDRKRVASVIGAIIALLALIGGAVLITSGGDDDTAAPSDSAPAAPSEPSDPSPIDNTGAPASTDAPTDDEESGDIEGAVDGEGDDDGDGDGDDVIITAGEIILEPLTGEPDDAFTESVAAEPSPELLAFASAGGAVDVIGADIPTDSGAEDPATTVDGASDDGATADPPAGPTTLLALQGTAPGVYGGTRDETTCDPALLVDALGRRPAEAAAWASVHDIEVAGIGEYVATLTAVNLTVDTRVTNHGFFEGEAIARQSVLQVGTAVLVDAFGVPRVRCSSGSPLLPPEAVEGTTAYTGPAWERFDPATTAAVAPAPAPATEFEVIDLAGGDGFIRPVGSSGGDDRALLPGEILAVGELAFDTEGYAFSVNNVEMVFTPTGGPVTATFAYSLPVQGISIDGSGDLTGTFDAATNTMTGTGFGTVSAGEFGSGSGDGGWTATVDPTAGTISGVIGAEGDSATFALTFEPYTPPPDLDGS